MMTNKRLAAIEAGADDARRRDVLDLASELRRLRTGLKTIELVVVASDGWCSFCNRNIGHLEHCPAAIIHRLLGER
jgi:hypothetical protein